MEAANTTRLSLDTLPVTRLKGVGPAVAERLERLGISTVSDLLFHLPLRYQDKTRLHRIGALQPGAEVALTGQILLAQIKFGKRRSLLVRLGDGSGMLTLRFFHFNKNQQDGFKTGQSVWCFGEIRRGPDGLEMVHPEYRVLREDQPPPLEQSLTAIYPATDQLQQRTLRNLVLQAMDFLRNPSSMLKDWLPPEILREYRLPDLNSAIDVIHQPRSAEETQRLIQGRHPAQKRLAFEELLAHQVSVRRLRVLLQQNPAPSLKGAGELEARFYQQLPFTLTGAQQRVIGEIKDNIGKASPMLRLVQGDVGSGKTVVAAVAALAAVEAGWQAAIMAPTEILAEQHYRNFSQWLEPLNVRVGWLSGRQKASEKRDASAAIREGEAQVVVGTHALFQDDVEFARLGLVVIDEQHRFGVHQRFALRDKGRTTGLTPHQLVMTATPIPRTLAMTAYADLDVSVIDELPPGRKPVETVVVPDKRRPEVTQRVEQACRERRQVYWVCPLIEESEVLECQAAEDTAELLSSSFPSLKVGLVHGRMKPADKDAVMSAFKSGELDLLVATTVIEVGVDVPNASLMIIENAERLGLSQLHQLRGRVGRGSAKSTCVLMYHGPLSQNGRERLAAMRETNDGFKIAQIDLELRGPGELLGTRQTGMLQFRVADLARDQEMLPHVEKTADLLLRKYPENIDPLILRWLNRGLRYGDV